MNVKDLLGPPIDLNKVWNTTKISDIKDVGIPSLDGIPIQWVEGEIIPCPNILNMTLGEYYGR